MFKNESILKNRFMIKQSLDSLKGKLAMAMVPVELTAGELNILVNSNIGFTRRAQLENELLRVMKEDEIARSERLRDEIRNSCGASCKLPDDYDTAWVKIVETVLETVANDHSLKESFLEHLESVQRRIGLEKSINCRSNTPERKTVSYSAP